MNKKELDVIDTKEFNLGLKNETYVDLKVSNIELVTLALISKNHNFAKELSIVSINMLLEFMYCKHSNSNIAKDIKLAIQKLIDKNVINIIDLHYSNLTTNDEGKEVPLTLDAIDNKTLFYVRLERLGKVLEKKDNEEEVREGFFKVMESDLDKLFKYLTKTNIDKFAIARYFIAIQRVISCEYDFGFLTQKQVKDFVGEGKTVSNYNRILQDELKLIRYNNSYVTAEKHYNSTYFGRYDDEANFTSMLNNAVSEKGLVFSDKVNSNVKRSVKQKANRVKKVVENTEDKARIKELEDEMKALKEQYKKLEYVPVPKVIEVVEVEDAFTKAVKEVESEVDDEEELHKKLELLQDKVVDFTNKQHNSFLQLFEGEDFPNLTGDRLKQVIGRMERFVAKCEKENPLGKIINLEDIEVDEWEGNEPDPNLKPICIVNDPDSIPKDVQEEFNKPPEVRILEAEEKSKLGNGLFISGNPFVKDINDTKVSKINNSSDFIKKLSQRQINQSISR